MVKEMTKRMQKKVFHGLRLVAAAVAAVLVILAVAMASGMLAADEAMGATNRPAACAHLDSGHPNYELLGCGDDPGEVIVNSTAQNILDALVWFGAAIAVAFIVVGGIKIVTSDGDQAKAVKGRNTVVFAVFGLIIALLATFITDEVIGWFMN